MNKHQCEYCGLKFEWLCNHTAPERLMEIARDMDVSLIYTARCVIDDELVYKDGLYGIWYELGQDEDKVNEVINTPLGWSM